MYQRYLLVNGAFRTAPVDQIQFGRGIGQSKKRKKDKKKTDQTKREKEQ
jgi:hypothetical protein